MRLGSQEKPFLVVASFWASRLTYGGFLRGVDHIHPRGTHSSSACDNSLINCPSPNRRSTYNEHAVAPDNWSKQCSWRTKQKCPWQPTCWHWKPKWQYEDKNPKCSKIEWVPLPRIVAMQVNEKSLIDLQLPANQQYVTGSLVLTILTL